MEMEMSKPQTDSTMVWDWKVPDIHEINRALDFINWTRQRDEEYARAEYAKRHTAHNPHTACDYELPCFMKDSPDMGVLIAVRALWRLQNNSQRLNHDL